jgi:hypothetical protein
MEDKEEDYMVYDRTFEKSGGTFLVDRRVYEFSNYILEKRKKEKKSLETMIVKEKINWVYDRTYEEFGGTFRVDPRIYEISKRVQERNRKIINDEKDQMLKR